MTQDTEALLAEWEIARTGRWISRFRDVGDRLATALRSSESARGRMEEALEDMGARLELAKPYLWTATMWEGFVAGLLNTSITVIAQREGEDV